MILIFDEPVLSGPTSQTTDFVGTGGGGGNPDSITISIGRIILQSNGWVGLNMPTSIAYTYPGGQRYLTGTPGFVADFAVSVPFP